MTHHSLYANEMRIFSNKWVVGLYFMGCCGVECVHAGDGGRRVRSREASECKDESMTVHFIPKATDRKCRKARVNLQVGVASGQHPTY